MARLDLRGRTAIVTGASSGIGACAARLLASRGAAVVLAARRLAELEKVADGIRAQGGSAHVLECDITTDEQNRKLVALALEKTGRLDVFVANAGVTMIAPFAQTKPETLRRLMDVNYFGVAYGILAALPHVLERHGQIAVVSSFTGKRGIPTRSGYAASKHAVHGLCDSLRVEILGTGTGVTLFCPSYVDTPIEHRALEVDPAALAKRPRGMSPERAAEILVRAIERRRREVIVPRTLKLALILDELAPWLVDRIMRRVVVPRDS